MKASTAVVALGSTLALVWGCSSSTINTGGTGDAGEGHDGAASSSSGASSGGSGSGGSSGGGSSSGSGSGSSSGSGSGSGSSSGSGSGSSSGSSSGGGSDAGAYVCDSPAQCTSASTPVCCANIPITGGTIPNCTTGPLTVACKAAADCATSLGTSCTGSQTVRLCAQPADCTETGANKCCTFSENGGSLSFCANAIVAGLGGGTCM